MSVANLTTTFVNIYSVVTAKDIYGANYEAYYLKYAHVPVRIRILTSVAENFIDGKEQSPDIFRIYIPYQLTIIPSDLIVDTVRDRNYDILYINKMDRKRHMQVDVRRVDSVLDIVEFMSSSSSSTSSEYFYSTSSDFDCPNTISSWSSDVFLI